VSFKGDANMGLSKFFKKSVVCDPVCKQSTASKIRRLIMPFSELNVYISNRKKIRDNYKKVNKMEKMLLALFVFNSILLIATAIYAPTVTRTTFYSVWQIGQLGLIFYIAYRSTHRGRSKK
jgi:hypothetical protein